MRQVFTSQRLETVEGVAHLLEQAGIGVYISNGRSYKGGLGGQFSFSDPLPARKQPTLWIKSPDDQPRAREILRQAGLLDSTRPDQQSSYVFRDTEEPASRRGNWGWRIRVGLLVLIAVAAFVTLNQVRKAHLAKPVAAPPLSQPQPQPQTQPQAQPQAPAAEQTPAIAEDEVRVRISPAQ